MAVSVFRKLARLLNVRLTCAQVGSSRPSVHCSLRTESAPHRGQKVPVSTYAAVDNGHTCVTESYLLRVLAGEWTDLVCCLGSEIS